MSKKLLFQFVLSAAAFLVFANVASAQQTINCSSEDMHRRYCPADTSNGVRLVQQRSDSACRKGYSWGYDRRGIWVDHGCRADFQLSGGRHRGNSRNNSDNGGYGRNDDYNRRAAVQAVSCNSDDMHRHYCPADTSRGVRLYKQHSDSACRQGYSWGYDRRGIWVDRGCRADFQTGLGGR